MWYDMVIINGYIHVGFVQNVSEIKQIKFQILES